MRILPRVCVHQAWTGRRRPITGATVWRPTKTRPCFSSRAAGPSPSLSPLWPQRTSSATTAEPQRTSSGKLTRKLKNNPYSNPWGPLTLLAALLFRWCYPSDVQQANGANCAYRAKTGLGSSKSYGPSIASTGYEGGSGYLSGDPKVTAWANWAVAYVKYCDGGSMTGTREVSAPPP